MYYQKDIHTVLTYPEIKSRIMSLFGHFNLLQCSLRMLSQEIYHSIFEVLIENLVNFISETKEIRESAAQNEILSIAYLVLGRMLAVWSPNNSFESHLQDFENNNNLNMQKFEDLKDQIEKTHYFTSISAAS